MTWQRFASRQGVDLTTIAAIDAVFYRLIREAIGNNREVFFTHLKDQTFTHYSLVDMHNVGQHTYRTYFGSPKAIKKYYKEGSKLLKSIQKKSAKFKETKDLLDAYHEFRKQFDIINFTFSIASFVAIEAWQDDCEEVLSELIKRNNIPDKEQGKIRASVYHPWKKTALIEIQGKLATGVSVSTLVQDYQFLRSWSIVWHRPIHNSFFENLRSTAKPDSLYSPEKVLHILKPNAIEKSYLTMAPYITFFKDWRDDLRRQFVFSWSFLFDQIAHHLKCERDDLGYLTLDEIEDAFHSGKVDIKAIPKRKYSCIITLDEATSRIAILERTQSIKYFDIINELQKQSQHVIKGMVAFPGKVTGRVILVHSYHDIKKVGEGDILVANTTHPNYLPAMHRAAAFVTNEGGMLCHAAIVARELHKPCIVGTANATKVLKDYDFVEVDANEGTVRKI